MKVILALVSAILICGCALDVSLMERGGMGAGHGTVPYTVANSGDITLHVNDEQYYGHWVLTRGGNYNFGNAFATVGATTGTAVGSGISLEASGNGNILARSASGKGLRCIFNYSGMSRTGTGVCQDDNGRVYDMQIH